LFQVELRSFGYLRTVTDGTERTRAETRILGAIKEAVNLNATGKAGLAVQLLAPLLTEFPEEPAVRIYLAWYLRRCERFEEAIGHTKRAVQMLPRSSRASLVLFHTLWAAANEQDAIEEIRRFLPIRRTDRYTSHYADVLRCWEARERGEGTQLPQVEEPEF
jgi:predicted Zn-dependent protease